MQFALNCKQGFDLPWFAKLLRVMKITLAILLIACLHVAANGYSQAITLTVKNAPLEKVFTEIKNQTGLNFFYSSDVDLQKANPVTLNVNNIPVNEVLDLCFKNQPFTYSILDKVVVIKQKSTKSFSPDNIVVSLIDIKGKVVNENGDPVAGVTVSIKGTKQATATNANGEFAIKNTDKPAILIFTGTNVETFQLNVGGQSELIVKLTTRVSKLDEIQVIAYGTTTKRLQTGNVSTVKAEELAKQPVNNLLLALEGLVPGIFITQSTGLPGSGVTVKIQGQNSISRGNDPFYVIDGIPYISQVLPSLNNVLGNSASYYLGSTAGNGNPLSFINIADIESIDILKDADATAIYGSRAANGAVIITTKKGKAGQTKVDINMQNGWGKITRKLALMNTPQYLKMRNDAITNDGLTIQTTDYDINGTWDSTRNTDWQKELIGGTAHYSDAQLNISGGNAATQFLVGSGYHKETSVSPGNFNDQKGSLHFNITNISSDQKFRLQLSGNYLIDNNQIPAIDFTSSAINMPPDAPAIYNVDGSLNWSPDPYGNSTFYNPAAYLNSKNEIKTSNLIGNALISYNILPSLEIKSSFGYTNMQTNEISTIPLVESPPEYRQYIQRVSLFGNSNINSWIIEPQASYKKTIAKGKLEALVGSTFQQNNKTQQQYTATGFNSDLVLEDISSASSVTVGPNIASIYKYNAVFGRLNYNWQNKYIINLSVRRDGSSRFGAQAQFHNFVSMAGAWIFSNEKFIQKNLAFLSFGKFRASYGTTGNDQIGDYQFLSLYSTTTNPLVAVPYQGANGLAPTNLPNPFLQWEETKKLQFGLDLGFFNDQILLNVNYVHNRSSNELLPYALPVISGFSSITKNFPAVVQNTAWEFAITSVNIRTNDFKWVSNLNLTVPQNKLIAFPNLANSAYASNLVVGQSINVQKVYHFLGVDPSAGLYVFADSKGNSTSNPNALTDRTVLINNAPQFYGGIQNSFRYKRIELDFSLQFVKQTGLNYFFGNIPGFFGGAYATGNQPVSIIQSWQKPGDIKTFQQLSSVYPSTVYSPFLNANSSDKSYSDASFIRLKNISLSWELPKIWIKKARLQNFRIYIQGQNLLTFTKYPGLDPENLNVSALPPLRILSMGLQLTL